jgi:hypothetical protein
MHLIQSLKKAPGTIKNSFNGKDEYRIFLLCGCLGFLSSVITFKFLNGFPYEMGKNLLGVFIPPFIAILYLAYTGSKYEPDRKLLLKTLLLYCVQIIPFIPIFFQEFQPTPANDFSRYYLYAKNMLDNNTLWGGDQLFYQNAGGMSYITQPGYRYFIFFELLVFRGLYRIVAFLNIVLFIVSVYSFVKVIHGLGMGSKLKSAMMVLLLLLTPFAVKNLLMGMPEWLTAVLLMGATYFYVVRKNEVLSVLLLGLVPFFRQNLLITTLLLFFWLLIQSKQKLKISIVFLIVLLLPVYHNLYYAGEWRFFVRLFDYPFYTVDRKISGYNINLIVNNIVHYLGIEILNGKPEISPIAIFFLPFSAILFFVMFNYLQRRVEKIYYFLTTMSAVGPAILMANAYYPRFEFMNVIVMIAAFSVASNSVYKVRTNPSPLSINI